MPPSYWRYLTPQWGKEPDFIFINTSRQKGKIWLYHSMRLFYLHSVVKIQPCSPAFRWRNPRLRHFVGYSFGASREKASTIFYNTAKNFSVFRIPLPFPSPYTGTNRAVGSGEMMSAADHLRTDGHGYEAEAAARASISYG